MTTFIQPLNEYLYFSTIAEALIFSCTAVVWHAMPRVFRMSALRVLSALIDFSKTLVPNYRRRRV